MTYLQIPDVIDHNVCHETEVIRLKPHGLFTGGHWITVCICLATSTMKTLFQFYLRVSKKKKKSGTFPSDGNLFQSK